MRCPTCDGRGWVSPAINITRPCPDCGGCGFAHCCEGDRAEPCPTPEPEPGEREKS